MWEKEKMLITSKFSFSHSVFKRPVLQTRKNQGLFGKGLIETQNSPSWEGQNMSVMFFFRHSDPEFRIFNRVISDISFV